MKIQITGKKSAAFAAEAVNVFYQCRALLKDPQKALKDSIGEIKSYIVIGGVLFILMGVMALLWGARPLTVVAMVLMVLVIALSLRLYTRLNGMAKAMEADERPSVLELAEEGVTLTKSGEAGRTLAWDEVAFVRVFRETVCFIPKDGKGYILAVSAQHAQDIFGWLRENRPETAFYHRV